VTAESPGQADKTQPVVTRVVRAVTWPGGKDVNWEKVRAVGAIIGAFTVLYGVRTRSWRYVRNAAEVLAIGAGAAGFLKNRYSGAAQAPESQPQGK
jgi:hypothetical protein